MGKRIIFDCERMKYPYTGLYYFCKELGKALLRQKPNFNELTFYLPQKEKGVFGNDENYIIQSHLHKFFPKNLSDYNIWHCTYQGSNYLPPVRSDIKIITTIHDLNFLHQGKTENKQSTYLQKLQKLVDRSNAIVTISNFVKNQIEENLDVTGRNIEVIYNGRNEPESNVLLQPKNLGGVPFFFSLGTITDKKNFHVLPAMLINNSHNLVIGGITKSHAYRNRIIEEANRLGVADRVKLIGPIKEEEKHWLYNHCAAFCFPSLAEGFGLPVIEAMQFGTPVILSKATSLPEIGGPNAFYFENLYEEDTITETANKFLSISFTDNKRKALIDWAGQFSWETAAKKYWELYKKV